MGTEIERKYLISGEFPRIDGSEIVQCYLCLDAERTIRVRIDAGNATLTIKGKTVGISRAEFEYAIPLEDAHKLMAMSLTETVEKTRYRVPHEGAVWEVDVFRGANKGLMVAEIELAEESETVALPDWVGEEVSADPRYRNSRLAQLPFTRWV